MRVAKWGNSLAIRLPAAVVDVLGLRKAMKLKSMLPMPGGLVLRASPGAPNY